RDATWRFVGSQSRIDQPDTGMSKGKKIAIGVGALVLIGAIANSTGPKPRSTAPAGGTQTAAAAPAKQSAPQPTMTVTARDLVELPTRPTRWPQTTSTRASW